MIAVIIAGGSGTRLWPLSTPDYPKHLLKLNNDPRSLLQNTYDRAKSLTDDIYIISESSHDHHVREQLPKLKKDSFIIEPGRRGTANCIVAALAKLTGKYADDQPIAFLHADHFIRDLNGFVHSFRLASYISKKSDRIVLVGVEPDHPSVGFGYIQKGKLYDEDAFVFDVHSFKEKPDYDTAHEYFKSGNYLWNAGYFIGSIGTFKKSMKKYAPAMLANYEKLLAAKDEKEFAQTYLSLENDAIDYALMERAKDLLVVPAAFDWMDLGSFGDLHKAVGGNEQGNHTHGERIEMLDVENSFIHNQEDKPTAIIGLDNIVVVNSPSGLLVARKDLAHKVGEVSKRFK